MGRETLVDLSGMRHVASRAEWQIHDAGWGDLGVPDVVPLGRGRVKRFNGFCVSVRDLI